MPAALGVPWCGEGGFDVDRCDGLPNKVNGTFNDVNSDEDAGKIHTADPQMVKYCRSMLKPCIINLSSCCESYALHWFVTEVVPSLHKDGGLLWLVLRKEHFVMVRERGWVKSAPVHYIDIDPDNDKLRAEIEPFLAAHKGNGIVVTSQRKAVKSPYDMPKKKIPGVWTEVIKPDIMVFPEEASDTLYQMAIDEDNDFERWLVTFTFAEASSNSKWMRKLLIKTKSESTPFKFITHYSEAYSDFDDDGASTSSSCNSSPKRPAKKARTEVSPPLPPSSPSPSASSSPPPMSPSDDISEFDSEDD